MEKSQLRDRDSLDEDSEKEPPPPPLQPARTLVWADLNVRICEEREFLQSLTEEERRNRKRYFRWLRRTPIEKWSFQERLHARSAVFMLKTTGRYSDVDVIPTFDQWSQYIQSEIYKFDCAKVWRPDTEFVPKATSVETASSLHTRSPDTTSEQSRTPNHASNSSRPELTISATRAIFSYAPIDAEATQDPSSVLSISAVQTISIAPTGLGTEAILPPKSPVCRFIRPRGTRGRIMKPITHHRRV
ncbi:hypothetical protein V8F20_009523 [Naviculisporaceae sp. PSN 640]